LIICKPEEEKKGKKEKVESLREGNGQETRQFSSAAIKLRRGKEKEKQKNHGTTWET